MGEVYLAYDSSLERSLHNEHLVNAEVGTKHIDELREYARDEK